MYLCGQTNNAGLQVFALQPLPNGQGYFCYNDVFRLNYG
jgi:hypothetical protein